MEIPKKIGPLPTWSFVVVLLGGLAVSYYIYSRQGGGSDEGPILVEDTSPVPGVGQNSSGWMYTPPPAPTPPEDKTPKTNEEWARMVITGMIAEGHYRPSDVDSAVRKYLQGKGLNAVEAAIRDLFLAKFGPPPYVMVPAEPDEPTPDPDPETPPPPPPPPSNVYPAAPTGLTATQVSAGKIHIQWNPVQGVSGGYWVRVTGPTSKTGLAFLWGTQFWHDRLKPGTYKVEVAGRRGLLSLDYGQIASITTTVT